MISVIIPCYNHGKYLRDAVESVILNKDFYNGEFEIIIINDGSPDNTKEIATELCNKYPNVKLINQENKGLPTARNIGIENSKGDWILPLDADDMIAETMFRDVSKLLNKDFIDIIYFDQQNFGKDERTHIRPDVIPMALLQHNNLISVCSLYRRKVWEANKYDPNFTMGEDWEFWISALKSGFSFYHHKDALFYYRIAENTLSKKNSLTEIRENLRKKHPDIYETVSVIIPTYNRPQLINYAIRSVLLNNYHNIEIIVVNDGGCDFEKFEVPNVKYYFQENKGLAAARNEGLKHATGDYICFLDDDDQLYYNHIETLVKALQKSEYKVAYTDAYEVGRERKVIYSVDFNYDSLLAGNYIPILCLMFKREVIRDFDETLSSHEDWDLLLRIGKETPFLHIPEVTCEYRQGEMSSNKEEMLKTTKLIYEKNKDVKPEIQELRNLNILAYENLTKTSIIIPVYNNLEFTKQCIKSIIDNTEKGTYEIAIIDNGSTDGTFEWLQESGLNFTRNVNNEGFARAVNKGIKYTQSPYIVLLNNDTIVTKDWLKNLLEASLGGITGNLLLFPDGTVQHSGMELKKYNNNYVWENKDYRKPLNNSHYLDYELDAVTGACMLINRNVVKRIGYFDTKFINGCEDIDYCLRAKISGFKINYTGKSIVYHYEGRTEGRFNHASDNIKLLNSKYSFC